MFRAMMVGMARATFAVARFAGQATIQAAERLIPQGSSEVSNLLNAGHGYHPVAPYAPPLQRSSTIPRQSIQPQRSMEMER